MQLKTVTHFSHGGIYPERNAAELLALLEEAGSDGIRDGLAWKRIEKRPGEIDFSGFRNSYIDLMGQNGVEVTLTLTPGGNPLYDTGKTVTSKKAIAAFADYIVAVAKEFPQVGTIVIGNEYNGLNSDFINGRAANRDIDKRVAIYTKIVKEVHTRLEKAGVDVDLGGGALHSVATGYVQAMKKKGTFAYIDALDFHPYGEDPVEVANSLARLNEVLDSLPKGQRPALIATEFGRSADPMDALSNADYLAKMVAVMADAGVDTAAWYALLDDDRGAYPDMGLYHSRTEANDMLESFQFVSALLDDDAAPTQVPSAPGIELYDFGNGTWLVWGSVQAISFGGSDLVFRDASGAVIDRPALLTDSAIYVSGSELTVSPASGPGTVLADSFYDYALTPDPDGPWSYHALKIKKGKESVLELSVMDGQTRMGESWNPYLGQEYSRPLRISADVLQPVGFGKKQNNDRATVERFNAESLKTVDIVGTWSVSDASRDGVVVEIEINGKSVLTQAVTGQQAIVIRSLELRKGDKVDFIVHDGADSSGDYVTRHIRVLEAQEDASTAALLAQHVAHDIIDGAPTQALVELNYGPDERPAPPSPVPTPGFDREVTGTTAADRLDVSNKPSDDAIFGLGGDDTMRGRKGDDLLDGGTGDDVIRGDTGNDTLLGGDGQDMLSGNADNDRLDGDAGADTLYGSSGEDTLTGGLGADLLEGGTGADLFIFAETDATDTIRDFNWGEGDRLDISALDPVGVTLQQWGKNTLVEVTTASGTADILLLKTDAAALESEIGTAVLM